MLTPRVLSVGPALAVVALGAVLVGCSSSSSGPASPRSPDRAPAGAGVSAVAALDCSGSIHQDPPPPDWELVLGVVALPTTVRAAALQTARTGDADPALRLFAKTGLRIKAGTRFELVVPESSADAVSIGWNGQPSTPSRRVTVACRRDASQTGWLAYPGGYWLPRPACVSLVVRVGKSEQHVRLGLGTPCPGQRPPQGPSER